MTLLEYLQYLLLLIFYPNSLKTMEWRMLKLTNKERKKHGLQTLLMQQDLRTTARKHSQDMARKNYFSHTNTVNQSPFDRLKSARITETHAGENLALIRGYPGPTQKAHEGLMNSPGHRANILNEIFNCVGIGVIQSLDKTYYFTQNFAKREIIFTKKIPDQTTLRKGLIIKGYTIHPLCQFLYELKIGQETIRKTINIQNKKFYNRINFPHIGIYEIKFYTPNQNKTEFNLVNQFTIKIKKSFFF